VGEEKERRRREKPRIFGGNLGERGRGVDGKMRLLMKWRRRKVEEKSLVWNGIEVLGSEREGKARLGGSLPNLGGSLQRSQM